MVSTRSGSVVAVGAQSAEVSSRRGAAAKSVPRKGAQAGRAKQGSRLLKKRADTAEEAVLLSSDQRAPQAALASVTEAPAGPAEREDDPASSGGDEDDTGPLVPCGPPASVAQAPTRPSEPARDRAGSASCSSSDESGDEDILPGLAASMWAALRTGRVALGPALPAVSAPSSSGRAHSRAPGSVGAAASAQAQKSRPGRASNWATSGASVADLARPEPVAGTEESEPVARFPEVSWDPQTGLPAPLLGAQTAALAVQPEPGLAKQVLATPRDARLLAKARRKARPDTAGRGWFELPATQITDEVKRDLRLLHLRSALDPKRFYKGFDQTKFPKHFQLGTVVEGAADFYSGRLRAKQRKATLTEELLADAELTRLRRKRYGALQDERTAHTRVKRRKTNLPRLKKAHRRPEH